MLRYSTAAESCDASNQVDPYGISLRRFLNAVAAWQLRRRQRAQLHVLSDRTLKDIGVSRWEIDGIIGSPNRDASGRLRWLEFDDYPRRRHTE